MAHRGFLVSNFCWGHESRSYAIGVARIALAQCGNSNTAAVEFELEFSTHCFNWAITAAVSVGVAHCMLQLTCSCCNASTIWARKEVKGDQSKKMDAVGCIWLFFLQPFYPWSLTAFDVNSSAWLQFLKIPSRLRSWRWTVIQLSTSLENLQQIQALLNLRSSQKGCPMTTI